MKKLIVNICTLQAISFMLTTSIYKRNNFILRITIYEKISQCFYGHFIFK